MLLLELPVAYWFLSIFFDIRFSGQQSELSLFSTPFSKEYFRRDESVNLLHLCSRRFWFLYRVLPQSLLQGLCNPEI